MSISIGILKGYLQLEDNFTNPMLNAEKRFSASVYNITKAGVALKSEGIGISAVGAALTGVGVVKLRYTMRDYPRPYRAWGYPIIPAIFILFSACFLVVTVYNDVTAYINGKSELINSFFGLLIVVAGFPLYWYFNRRKNLNG